MNLLLLIGASAVLSTWGILLNRRHGGVPPFVWCIIYPATVFLCGPAPIFLYVLSVGGGFMVIPAMCLGLLIYSFPIYLGGCMVAGMLSEMTVAALMGSSLGQAPRVSYGKAVALAKQSSPLAAVRQYRKYFDEDPKVPTPLFRAAELLEERQQYNDAERMYKEIMHLFEKQTRAWGEAGFRLSELYEQKMDMQTESVKLLMEIRRRGRYAADKHRAATWLTRIGAPPS